MTLHAIELRSAGSYASHPVEAALRYHRAQAEIPGEEGDGSFDFKSAESLYRAGAQGLRLSEIPQLPQNLRELSRLGAVDRAARTHLRRWVESHGPVFDESTFLAAWEAQGHRGGAEHHVYHDQEVGRWVKRLYFGVNHSTLGDYFDRMRLHAALFPETAYRLEGFTIIDPFISLARRGTWAAIKLAEIGLPTPPDDHQEANASTPPDNPPG